MISHGRNSTSHCLITGVLFALIFSVSAMAQSDPNCCVGRVGDANGLGGDQPTIGDVSAMIDAKFISIWACESLIPCMQEADINQSGGVDPECDDVSIGDISILIDHLFIGGPSNVTLPDCLEPSSEPYGYVTAVSDCLNGASGESSAASASVTCLVYEYDGVGTLDITHQDAVLNCCPMPSLTIEIEGNTITITEADDGMCDCLCLNDIDYRLENLPPDRYHVFVNEAYPGGGEPLEFIIDLTASQSGTLCVDRAGYPWGGAEPELEFIGNSGCLSEGAAASASSSDSTCVSFEYNEFGTLSINHSDAGFNCCPGELGASFVIDGNTITITETEDLSGGGCHCLCLFDLEYWITNVPPGEYDIVINGPYLPAGDQPLEFTLDLSSPTDGMHCAARTGYPWD